MNAKIGLLANVFRPDETTIVFNEKVRQNIVFECLQADQIIPATLIMKKDS